MKRVSIIASIFSIALILGVLGGQLPFDWSLALAVIVGLVTLSLIPWMEVFFFVVIFPVIFFVYWRNSRGDHKFDWFLEP